MSQLVIFYLRIVQDKIILTFVNDKIVILLIFNTFLILLWDNTFCMFDILSCMIFFFDLRIQSLKAYRSRISLNLKIFKENSKIFDFWFVFILIRHIALCVDCLVLYESFVFSILPMLSFAIVNQVCSLSINIIPAFHLISSTWLSKGNSSLDDCVIF